MALFQALGTQCWAEQSLPILEKEMSNKSYPNIMPSIMGALGDASVTTWLFKTEVL